MPSEDPNMMSRYEAMVGHSLKTAIWSKGLTIRAFADILTKRGAPHSFEALSRKLYRGTFSAALYVLCLDILAETPASVGRPATSIGDDMA